MTAMQTQSRVRPFTEEDIPQVITLHLNVTGWPDKISPAFLDSCRAYLAEVFLENRWRDEGIGSLVHQEADGTINGFIGVVPVPMSMNGNAVRAAILCEFVVDPSARGVTGLKLFKTAIAGAQDLSFGDRANASSRQLFEGLGGITSLMYSTRWIYPLRPFEFIRYFFKKEGILTPDLLSSPEMDALRARFLNSTSPPANPQLTGEDLTCETLLACWAEFPDKRFLRPDYDERSLGLLLDRVDRRRRKRRLLKVLVKSEKGKIAGWYLCYVRPRRPAEVLQLYAKPGFARRVVEHLLLRAWEQDAIAVVGRLEPDVMEVVSDMHCLCQLGPDWMVVHSRRPDLLRAFERAEVRLSRIDGEPPSAFLWPDSADALLSHST